MGGFVMRSKLLGAITLASAFALSACTTFKMPDTEFKVDDRVDRLLNLDKKKEKCKDTCSEISVSARKPFSSGRSVKVTWEYTF